jgi:hypothetical protein
MRVVGAIAGCLVLVIGGVLAFWKFGYPTYTYRYRLVVEIEADRLSREGSSVIEIEVRTQPNILDNPTISVRVHGEAVFVDLGEGQHVIALLAAGPKAEDVGYPDRLVPLLLPTTYRPEDLPKLATLRGRREVADQHFPTFATFADLNEATSAHVVQPDEFARVFRPGVHVKKIWFEMTGDPVTRRIEAKLPVIIRQLRKDARVMHVKKLGDPFVARLGLFIGD